MKMFDRHKNYEVLIKEENGNRVKYRKVVRGSTLNYIIDALELDGK